MKYQTRYTGKAFQALRQLIAFNLMNKSPEMRINLYNQVVNSTIEYIDYQMGVTQHHDAVSGTAKQKVQDDYYVRLYSALDKILEFTNLALSFDIKSLFYDTNKDNITNSITQFPKKLNFCDLQDPYLKTCLSEQLNDNNSTLLVIYNPTDNNKKVHKVPIKNEKVTVLNNKNEKQNAEVFCDNVLSGNKCWLYFVDYNMKAFSPNYYILKTDLETTTTKKN